MALGLMIVSRNLLHVQTPGNLQIFLDSVIENIPHMIFVKDAKDLKFVRFNSAGEKLIGLSRTAMIGKNDYDFFPKDQADSFTQFDRMVIANKKVQIIPEEPLTTANGVRTLYTKKIPILNGKGEPIYLLGISEDITEKKVAEQQAIKLRDEQAANKAKTAFLAKMSHEIRTPLSAILGFSDLITSTKNLSCENISYINTIKRNGTQLLKIADEILDVSKIESNRLVICYENFLLTDVIEDVASMMGAQAEAKNLAFDVVFKNEMPIVINSDSTRMRQILINIIGNSIKFTESGGVKIEVSASLHPENINCIILDFLISDTGPGIPSDQTMYLFKPFSQVDLKATKKYGGTGLGLYISKKFAIALGGDLILVRSQQGVGSTFAIKLQVKKVENKNMTKGLSKNKSLCTSTTNKFKQLNVLVIDDCYDNRLLVSKLIAHIGHDVVTAESGKEGIKLSQEKSFDIIFMDLEMPELDGFDTITQLRKMGCNTPICALTAHAMKGDRERCLSSGFDNYLAKPINIDLLRKIIETYGVYQKPIMHE